MISFNTLMVEAVLAGTKTQTRRPGEKPPAAEGDVICVREMHCLGSANIPDVPRTMNPANPDEACYYRAGWKGAAPGRWRRSLYMPRWAARLFLSVTGVRQESLREISEDDARQEGVTVSPGAGAVDAFAALWDSIYGERGAGWEANPPVWRVTFQLTGRPGRGQSGEHIGGQTT